MVTGVGTTMPTGGVTVGATPPAQHVPQEAGQPPAQTTPSVTTTRRSSENRRVSLRLRNFLIIMLPGAAVFRPGYRSLDFESN